MRTAIVYESMFGNTETLALAVARGLRERRAEVVLHRAGDPTDHDLGGLDLLVLAAPTHALSLSRPATRADAVTQGAVADVAGTGIREWLDALAAAGAPGEHPPVAVFDTRARVARHWPGAASRATARVLGRQGFAVVARTSFYVQGVPGPLLDGEEDRALAWGREIAWLAVRA